MKRGIRESNEVERMIFFLLVLLWGTKDHINKQKGTIWKGQTSVREGEQGELNMRMHRDLCT